MTETTQNDRTDRQKQLRMTETTQNDRTDKQKQQTNRNNRQTETTDKQKQQTHGMTDFNTECVITVIMVVCHSELDSESIS